MTFKPRTTRRNLLAGLGSLGFLGLGSVAARSALGLDPVEYTQSKRLTDTDADLVLDWRATYNGDVVAETDFETPGGPTPGPVVRLSNVLPGDEGTLTVRISVVSPQNENSASPVDVSMWVDLFETAENGRTEPERRSGDTDDTVGELQDAMDVTAWYDVGAGAVDVIGGCNGRREPGEEVITDGSLASVASSLEDPVRLDPHDGSDDGCLPPNSSVCLTVSWSIDSTVGNRIQTDSVAFVLGFEARRCAGEQRTSHGGTDDDT